MGGRRNSTGWAPMSGRRNSTGRRRAPAERLFAALLALYPADLRRAYGIEITRAFRDQLRDRRRGGLTAVARMWLEAARDVARTHRAVRRDSAPQSRRSPLPFSSSSFSPSPPGNPMETILNDLRVGIRNFVRNPLFAAAATVTLAIGVGASVTMFSGLSNFVLEPLPFADQDDLYSLYSVMPARGDADSRLSYRDYLDLRATEVFAASGTYYSVGHNLAGADEPVRVEAIRGGAELFTALGVDAEIGRLFTLEEEQRGAAVVVISDGLWRRQFGADRGVVGATVRLDGSPYTVIGVMPRNFWFPTPQYDAWLPLDVRPTTSGRDARFLLAVGRLHDGLAPGEAQSRLVTTAQRLASAEPQTNGNVTAARLVPLASEIIWEEMRMALYMLTVTGFVVLLIACVNVANLLVAKGIARRRELAVRAALGAGRWRLVRQYLAENLVLGVAGGALGLVIARFGIAGIGAALAANEPGRVPRLQEFLDAGFDARVILFAFVASIGAVLFFSLLPALHATRGVLRAGLQENSRGGGAAARGRRLQKSLVIVEVALTLALLVGAGLTLRSHAVVMQTDPGMQIDRLLTVSVALSGARYQEDHQAEAFFDQAITALGTLPAVDGAAATSSLPSARQGRFGAFVIDGRVFDDPREGPWINRAVVTPDYFEVLGATITRGRGLRSEDDASTAPVAVINESFARTFWPDDDPVGARIRAVEAGDDAPWVEIVGVVSDFRNNGLHRSVWPALYLPLRQDPARRMTVLLRTDADPLALVPAARAAMVEVDADLPLFSVMSMRQVFDNRFWGETLTMNLLTWCAIGAMLLAVVGIYGVISYTVTQRTREMGVRIALGARAGDVVGLVVRQGLWLAVVGIGFGLLLGFGLSRGLSFMLFGVSGNDPLTYAAVVVLLASVAAAASYVPARRATRVDPVVALRE